MNKSASVILTIMILGTLIGVMLAWEGRKIEKAQKARACAELNGIYDGCKCYIEFEGQRVSIQTRDKILKRRAKGRF